VRQAPIARYVADFLRRSARLIVEVDGATHTCGAEVAHDAQRAVLLPAKGYRVLWVTNDEVYGGLEDVLETILSALEGRLERFRTA
jgi:very-short-patch-repair endonuclease